MNARTKPSMAIFFVVALMLSLDYCLGGNGGDFIIKPGDLHPQLDGRPKSYPSEWDIATPLIVNGEIRAEFMHVSVFLYILVWAEDETYHNQDFIEICFDVGDDGYNTYDDDDNCLRVYRDGERYESNKTIERDPSNDWTVAVRGNVPGQWFAEYKIEYGKFDLRIGKPKNMGLMLRSWDKNKGKIDVMWPNDINYDRPLLWGNLTSSNEWRLHPSLVSRPKLLEGDVSPASGRYPTDFNFSVIYQDEDGNPPLNVSVFFGDRFYRQMLQEEECDPKEGCLFQYNETLAPDDYTFFFWAQNRQHAVKTDNSLLEVKPEKNYIPQIKDPILEPFVGDRRTIHEFGFEYYDEGGQHPVSSDMVVEGLGKILMRRHPGCRPEQGCWYYYNERFSPGFYEYYYKVHDGYYFVTSNRSWFRIDGFNSTPTLSQGNVTPQEGTVDTKFEYSVRYRDLDGDYADFVVVNIDGERRGMMTVPDCEPSLGCLFSINKRLENGSHEYFFEAGDGNATVRFPTNRTLSGPTVTINVTGTGDGADDKISEEAPEGGWSLELDDNMKIAIVIGIAFGIFYFIRSSRIKKRKKRKKKFKTPHQAARKSV